MRITKEGDSCEGFRDCGTFAVTFNFSGGVQHAFHQNPGARYPGTSRVAYIPSNREGAALLERVVAAWKRGLLFTIGVSLTTNQSDVITWASVHFKTGKSGGVARHGYPDPNYFMNTNEELDNVLGS